MSGSNRRQSAKRDSRFLRGRLIGATLATLWLVASATAQSTTPPKESAAKPPTARVADKPPIIGNILAAVLVFGVVVTASLIPSKRGHQD